MEKERNNYAIFIDLENCGGKVETFMDVIEKVKMRGDILLGKAYGYTERYTGLKSSLLSNTFTVVPSIRWGYNQKNNQDIQLVIDALEVAYKNDLIDCFCIVSGDSDYTPLVGKLKSMGKYVLGISRSEVASKIFINACNEFVFLETVAVASKKNRFKKKSSDTSDVTTMTIEELNVLIERILSDQGDADSVMYASELKKTLKRLRPDFDEKEFGCSTFSKLLKILKNKFKSITLKDENNIIMVSLAQDEKTVNKINKSNWKEIFIQKLKDFKEDGFERVNPSIIKSAVQSDYPGFDEKDLGFKRFSDIMKELEKDKIVKVEFDDTHSMLLKII